MITEGTNSPGLSPERREYLRRWQMDQRASQNEVTLPEVIYPELRAEFATDLEAFYRKAFPDIFSDPFGKAQKESIKVTQQKLMEGGRNLNILEPRGFGKSTRGVLARVWALLNCYRRLMLFASSSQTKAKQLMRIVHLALSRNQILLGCYPEIWPFHALRGNPHKAVYQTYQGQKTEVRLRSEEIQMADLGEDHKTSRARLFVIAYEAMRGVMIEGDRPDDVVLDDIQKTKDALSPAAIEKLMIFYDSDIAFLGSRKNPVSVTNNATIIRPDDFPDQLSKRKGVKTIRYRMVEQFPPGDDAKKLWEQYHETRYSFTEEIEDDDLRAKREALEFYESNRETMDAGSIVTWDHAFSRQPHDYEVSTIQSAYNFIQDFGQAAFDSECQNDPPRITFESDDLTREHIKAKQHGQPRGIVPNEAELVVCDIDVQGECVFYTEAAGNRAFDAFIIDYGTFPSQKRKQFSKAKLVHTFSKRYKGSDEESRIYQGVKEFLEIQLQKTFKRDGDGLQMRFDALAVDVKWNEKIIRRAIRDVNDPRIFAYNGHGIGPNKAPMASWKKGDGERKGIHWHLRAARSNVRNLVVDVNFWKTFVKRHFLIPPGQTASLSVFKADPSEHDLYSKHIKAENGTTLVDEQTGRRVETWVALPGVDNDWLDTTTGSMALLSVCGAECLGAEAEKKKTKKRRAVTYF